MKDFQNTPYGRAAASVGGFFERAREKLHQRSDGEIIAGWIRGFFAALSPALFCAVLSVKAMPLFTYPLGIALVSAAGGETLFFALGGIAAALLTKNIPLGIGLLSCLGLRFAFSRLFASDSPLSRKIRLSERIENLKKEKRTFRDFLSGFNEGTALRLAVSSLAAFTMGMMRLVGGGFSPGDLVGTCLAVAFCPCLTYLYTGCMQGGEKSSVRYEIGLLALLISFVYALSDFRPLGFSVSTLAAALISYLMARKANPMSTALFALLSILAAEPALSPALAVSAALAALLFTKSRLYAVSAGAISFAGLTFFTGGLPLFAGSFPEYMTGVLLSLSIPTGSVEKLLPFFGAARRSKAMENEILSYKEKENRDTLSDISASFEALSKTFFELSDTNTRIGVFDMRQLCDRVCDRHCRTCAACELCWERDYAVTLDTLNKISARMYKTGRVRREDLPPEFLARCKSADRILADIEAENTRMLRDLLREDKSRAFAVDYAVFARILNEALQKNEAEYAPNSEARAKALESLEKIGFSADSIGVYGSRKKSVYAFRLGSGAMKCQAETLKGALASALGCAMEDPLFEFADGGINMICRAAPAYTAAFCLSSCAAQSSGENGDRVLSFDNKNGYFYALVSDGMGSGAPAAEKSRAAGIFLEKMLRAGNSVSSAIEMLSAFARAGGGEVFTTVDLFELDCITGKCAFVKSGAAPSFVKRGNRIFKIRSKTFPIGILEDVDAEKTAFDCEDGDAVVMLSDGVTEDIEEPLWLCEFLMSDDLYAPDAAEKILEEAKQHTLCRDDMSAAVILIRRAEEKQEKAV